MGYGSYEEACRAHRWVVPARYNIAADVCDRHPRERLAMIHEHCAGAVREVRWGELQDLAGQAANVLAALGVGRGDRVAVVLPPTPETAAVFFATWKLGALLLSMSVLYGDEGIRHRLGDSPPAVLVTDAANARPLPGGPGAATCWCWTSTPSTAFRRRSRRSTRRPTIRRSCTTPRARRGSPRGSSTPTATCSATRSSTTATTSQPGERFHGMGEWAWAAGIAPLLGPWRRGAVQCVYQREAGFDPHRQLAFLSRHEVTNVFATPTAIRSMMAIDRRAHALPAALPHRLLGGRAAEPGGDPLVPRAVRRHRARLLRAHRVLPAVRELPLHGGPRGLDGPADARLGGRDPRPRRAAGARAASAARSACARAPTRTTRSATGGCRQASEETFGGEWFHTKDAARMDEDGYVWYEGRADDVIISAGYRIGPFEVESACLEHPAVAEAAAVAVARRAPRQRRQGVRRARRRARGLRRARRGRSRRFVRERLSAYAYPRLIEFVDELPKTLTGKIRRIELRERDADGPRAQADALRCASGGSPTRPGRLGRPAGPRTGSSRWPVPVVGSVTPPRQRHEVLGRSSSAVIYDRDGWGSLRAPPPTFITRAAPG